jgi:hypothetical protein
VNTGTNAYLIAGADANVITGMIAYLNVNVNTEVIADADANLIAAINTGITNVSAAVNTAALIHIR